MAKRPSKRLPLEQASERIELRQSLLDWYDQNKRDLPWRRTNDPYKIWVSEIMLQQTRVDTVIPYFRRFLERFPTAKALAEAPEDDVLAMWSGLGYYRRAKLLQRGAQTLVRDFDGVVPRHVKELLSLPGIGRYTAGAISSVAFQEPAPIVDGNVARVLSRVLRLEAPLASKESETALWEEAEKLAPGERPGDLNQGLMELGAMVCTPRNPGCTMCPIQKHCQGRDIADRLPTPKRKKTKVKEVRLLAILPIRARPRAVFLRRERGNLFGGLWSPPLIERSGSLDEDAASLQNEALFSCRLMDAERVGHVLSHRKLQVDVIRATHIRLSPGSELEPVTEQGLDKRGVSTLTRKLLAAHDF